MHIVRKVRRSLPGTWTRRQKSGPVRRTGTRFRGVPSSINAGLRYARPIALSASTCRGIWLLPAPENFPRLSGSFVRTTYFLQSADESAPIPAKRHAEEPELDQPLAIRDIKRFIADNVRNAPGNRRNRPEKVRENSRSRFRSRGTCRRCRSCPHWDTGSPCLKKKRCREVSCATESARIVFRAMFSTRKSDICGTWELNFGWAANSTSHAIHPKLRGFRCNCSRYRALDRPRVQCSGRRPGRRRRMHLFSCRA